MIDDRLYSAILCSLEQTHCARMWFYMSDYLFIACFFNIHRSGVLTVLAWLVPHETASVSAQVLCTPYNHAPCHFMQTHIRKVYASLAVTCHLHFWQNVWDLLRATAIFLNRFLGGFFYRFLSNDMARDATTICFHFNNSA